LGQELGVGTAALSAEAWGRYWARGLATKTESRRGSEKAQMSATAKAEVLEPEKGSGKGLAKGAGRDPESVKSSGPVWAVWSELGSVQAWE